MQDKTTFGVSIVFRYYIEALMEEVVFEGFLNGVEGRRFTSKINGNSIFYNFKPALASYYEMSKL